MSGSDAAVEACLTETRNAGHVADTIENVRRQDEGWWVEGNLEGGRPFTCSVDASRAVTKFTLAERAPPELAQD